jgi:hypothetical protein
MEKAFIIFPVALGGLLTLLEGSTRHSRHYENVIIILLLYSHMCVPAPSRWVEGLPPPDLEGC